MIANSGNSLSARPEVVFLQSRPISVACSGLRAPCRYRSPDFVEIRLCCLFFLAVWQCDFFSGFLCFFFIEQLEKYRNNCVVLTRGNIINTILNVCTISKNRALMYFFLIFFSLHCYFSPLCWCSSLTFWFLRVFLICFSFSRCHVFSEVRHSWLRLHYIWPEFPWKEMVGINHPTDCMTGSLAD